MAMADPATDVESDWLSPDEYGRRARLSIATVRRYLASGLLPKYQPGGHRCAIRIPASALNPHTLTQDQESPSKLSAGSASPGLAKASELPGPAPRWKRRRIEELNQCPRNGNTNWSAASTSAGRCSSETASTTPTAGPTKPSSVAIPL